MKNPRFAFLIPSLMVFAAFVPKAHADVRIPLIFGDHMVLQRDVPVKVWGEADPGEQVAITLEGSRVTATANASGRWETELPQHGAGGPFELTFKGKNTITLKDVLVGEVWFTTGQSNSNTPVKEIPPEMAAKEIPAANYPQIRHWDGGGPLSATRLEHFAKGSWSVCTPEAVGNFKGLSYFFAKKLFTNLNVPIGVIHTGCGGSSSEAWTSQEGLEQDPAYQRTLKQRWEKNFAEYPARVQLFHEKILPKWEKAAAEAKAAGQPIPKKPGIPGFGPDSSRAPAACFNALVAPLIPFTFRGVVWYQGESNSDKMLDAQQYRTLLPTLIADWRTQWKRPEMPFLIVQIANFQKVQTQPVELEAAWPWSREAQTMALSLPHTGMSVSIDINDEPDNIHPRNKVDVGHRIGLVALAKTYGKKIPYSGPMFSKMKVEASKARLSFDHTDGGLKARGEGANPELKGFALAGEDGNFVWADAKIEGDAVVLSSPLVPRPAAVRYNWAQNPIGNFYNGAGLPANPFRTDPERGVLPY